MYRTFLDSFYDMISSFIDMLKDSSIASYLFGGVTLWLVLLTFFAASVVLHFFINSAGSGRGLIFYSSRSDRQDPIPTKGKNNNG